MNRSPPSLPNNLRLYAVGDIHGRLDLLEQLLKKINADRADSKIEKQLVFLGDYVDRGLYSRGVIERLLKLAQEEANPPVFLKGNHEHVMLELLHIDDLILLGNWKNFGGREAMLSYGITSAQINGDPQTLLTEFRKKVPPQHKNFLENLALYAEFGDYFFCHAGVRPGVALLKQDIQDLLWIRREFLDHQQPYSKMIVHGHTIVPEVEFKPNRIDIDTGAYATGRLTSLALEGPRQWLIQTG